MRTKEEIRRFIREERAKLKPERVKDASWLAQKKLVAMQEFKKSKSVCCYLAMPDEVDTDLIVEMCWTDGKKVCVPAYRKERKRYGLSGLDRDSKVGPGMFGVPEPVEPEWVGLDLIDFVVVPGLGFDPFGGRVGHGGGYYDRILRGLGKTVFKAGLAFDFQIFERVPMSLGDVRMDAVITEKWVFKSAGGAIQDGGVE